MSRLKRPVASALQNRKKSPKAEEEKVNIELMQRLCSAENDEVRRYVLTKPLQKPRTNALTMILILVGYFGACICVSIAIIKLLPVPLFLRVIIAVAVTLCIGFSLSKFILIKAVECYQHYAKEETRRRCLCMPTCSEYAIAALKKYSLFVALRKIRKRLFVTCNGAIYLKDFP